MEVRKRSYVPFIVAAVATIVVGLAIGGWQGNEQTALNSVSKILLTIGPLAFVASVVVEVLRRRKLA